MCATARVADGLRATAQVADELCATTDLGLVFLFFIRGSHEEIQDESGPKTPQLVFPFFVERPNEEIPDDRRSTAAHNLSGTARDLSADHPQPGLTRIFRAVAFEFSRANPLGRICLRHISHGHFAHLRKQPSERPRVSNLPERRNPAAKVTAPNRRTAGRSHATTPPADGLRATAQVADELCATTDLGLVFLFFIRGSHEEIQDESGPKTPQLVFPFFVERPNEEIPDDRRSTAAHNLSGTARDLSADHPQPGLTRIFRAVAFEFSRANPLGRICLRHISHGHFAHLRKQPSERPRVSNLPERRNPAAKVTAPNRRTAGRSHATTPPADGLRATYLEPHTTHRS